MSHQNLAIAGILLIALVVTLLATIRTTRSDPWAEIDRTYRDGKRPPVADPDGADPTGEKRWQCIDGLDTAGTGAIKILVRFVGETVKPRRIDTRSFSDCHDEGQVLHNDLGRVNGDRVRWAFLHLAKGPAGLKYRTPPPRILSMQGCIFRPHVLGLLKGQKLYIVNRDRAAHSPNFPGMPAVFWNEQPQLFSFDKVVSGLPVSCQIHSWMNARIHVLDHPYFATTDEKGMATLKMLPAGEYLLAIRHSTFTGTPQRVKVMAGSTTEVTFGLK